MTNTENQNQPRSSDDITLGADGTLTCTVTMTIFSS